MNEVRVRTLPACDGDAEQLRGEAESHPKRAQGEFEGKEFPLIGAVPNGAADHRSGGDRTEAMSEAKQT
jgi:hypothetical protein